MASIFISCVSSISMAALADKSKKKQLLLPYDSKIKLRHPIRNPNFDLNLGLSLQRNDMPQVQRWYSDGADVNAWDNRGQSFLYRALDTNRIAHIKFLLLRRASVNRPNKDGIFPLEAAVFRGNITTVKYLLERNALARGKMRTKDISYLQYALDRGQQQMVILLIKHGANVNARYPDNSTLLHHAASRGLHQIVTQLLSKRANAAVIDRAGVTPLHEAAAKGQTQIMQLLLRANANVDATTNKRWTPLHHAARFGHPQAARFLLSRGASPFIRNSEGKSAADLARHLKHNVVYDMLVAHGSAVADKQKQDVLAEKKAALAIRRAKIERMKRQKIAKATNSQKKSAPQVVAKSQTAQPKATQQCFLFFCN